MDNCCKVAKVLVLIGALNLGLIGVGSFLGRDLDVVNIVLGAWPTAVALFNVLVGLSAVCLLVKCKKCLI